MTGLTSVTFRQLMPEQIIELAASAGIGGIEWGGDIHLPPDETSRGAELAEKTQAAGLAVLSYGSYYRLGEGMDFEPVLRTAVALGAPNIRIWAGSRSPFEADGDFRGKAAAELHDICVQAGEMTISLEYHRKTLTETMESTLSLLQAAAAPNLRTYWQPNPELSHEENCRELSGILPYLSNIHVFHWLADGTRQPLSGGERDWQDYWEIAEGEAEHWILEFVQEDSPEQLRRDARTLKCWLSI